MKKQIIRIFLCFSFLLSLGLAFPSTVYAQSGTGDDQLILGQSYTLESGKIQEGSIIVFGGTLLVENGARVNGDVFIAGGSLDLKGIVKGTVSSLGSYINIGETAVIESDLSVVGGTFNRSDKAKIAGHVDISSGEKINFARPSDVIGDLRKAPLIFDWGPIKDIFGGMSRVLGLSALAALLALFLIKPVERVAQAVTEKPMMSFLIGLLTVVVAPALMVVLIITIILSPFGLLGLVLLGAAILFGWVAAGYEVGRRITGSLKVDWAPVVVAGVGALVLSALSELANFIPCFGWIIPTFISLLGLGAVIMSRFGTQAVEATPSMRPPSAPLPAQAPTPPAPPPEGGFPPPPTEPPTPPASKKVAAKKTQTDKPESPAA